MAELAELEADPLDALDEVIGGLGRSVRDVGGVPRNELGSPAMQNLSERADPEWHRHIGHVVDELVDERGGPIGVVDGVEASDGLLGVPVSCGPRRAGRRP